MKPDLECAYETLSLEAAARVDALCDGFEKAWKATRSGASAPCVSTYLGASEGNERTVLTRELLALERACRERYGSDPGLKHSNESRRAAPAALTSAAGSQGRASDRLAGQPVYWPQISGLELLDVLGSGGMAVVFKARQVALGREVAVKFLRDAHRALPDQRERFIQEARAIARLRHPHLVALHEFGEVPAAGGAASWPYLVLEYVSGGSLADILRGAPQPPGEAVRLVATLADAIHYAHQQGVIHRDLKPANVLLQAPEGKGDVQPEAVRGPRCSPPRRLTADICAKVTDFGLAKFSTGGDLTHSGDVVGTPSYMAPEQAAGKSLPITVAVDVYGLGAILYEALTGRPPFAAATVDATLGLVRRDEPVPPRRLQPTVPRDLETICLKCLRKEPGRRYATAHDLALDLSRFQAGEPILARPVNTTERVVVWCRRKPGFAGLVAALVLVFLAGSSGVLWQWQRASAHAIEAQRIALAFRRERDTARSEKTRTEHHLQIIHNRIDRLKRLGSDLFKRTGFSHTGQAVLEEALACYEELLPKEGNDPVVRHEAAQLLAQIADIEHTLDQVGKAAETWERQASLLTGLLAETPASQTLRSELAYSHRRRGNALRDLGRTRQAREAYDQAARLEEVLLRETPDEPNCHAALANTLLNIAVLDSSSVSANELGPLFCRIVELDRAAVRIAPAHAPYSAELALALGDQGIFLLETGHHNEAEAAVREAVQIHERVLAGGELKGSVERYVARNCVNLGRVLAAAGKAREAERAYRRGVDLLDRVIEEFPEGVHPRIDLARSLPFLAELLKNLDRSQEALEIRQRVTAIYEKLRAGSPDDPEHRRNLMLSYLHLACQLHGLGRPSEAAEPYQRALAMEEGDPAVNNELAWFLVMGPEPCLRDAARALRLAQKVVTARPDSADYRNTLGVAYYRSGNDKAAIAALEQAMAMRSGGTAFDWFFLAMAHYRLGDRARAHALFDRSVEWMARRKPHDDELCRIRAEARVLLAGQP